jgi:hypothetical protein
MRAVGKLLVPGVLFCASAVALLAQEPPPASDSGCTPQQTSTVVAAAGPEPAAGAPPAAPVNPAPAAVSKAAVTPLTPREKFNVFERSTYSPYTFVTTIFNAAMVQAQGDWYSYGGGMEGYGKRFGASLANTESGVFFGTFLYPTLFRQDPRYFAEGRGPAIHRIAYAASRVLITKNDAGSRTFNTSHVLAGFTASGLTNAYYPREDRGFGDVMVRASSGLLNDAVTNVLREFWPDIKRKLIRHEPASIKRLEEKPTVVRIEQMMNPPLPTSCPLSQSEPGTKNAAEPNSSAKGNPPPQR